MLRSLFSIPDKTPAYRQSILLDIDGENVAVSIRHNDRAKRYTLRLSQRDGTPVLTIPRHGTHAEAVDFAERHKGWLQERMSKRPGVVAFEPGAVIPFRGVDHILYPTGKSRGTVSMSSSDDKPTINVPGDETHFERRLTDWLKKQARGEITSACEYHAANLGLAYRSISIRDQRTRWGSCSSEGRLNFSWRLVLAPPEVLDYVAAHEVAHLQEMNHQPQFWRLVEKTCPNMKAHRAWLRAHGGNLHSYGA